MRLVPKSLAGQLIALLLPGLFAAHWVALQLSGKAQGGIHKISQDQLVERYATAYRVLASCPSACDRAAILVALKSPDAQFLLTQTKDPLPPMSGEDARLASAVAASLDAASAATAQPHVRRIEHGELPGRALSVGISSTLPDGGRLVGVMWPVVRKGAGYPLGHGMLEGGMVIFILVGVFAARLRRPLRAISAAYDRIGRGEKVAPLPTDGPRELREIASGFNIMQERLARFVAERTRMMAAISHDLRTPITSLRLRAEMVDDHALRVAMVRTLDEMRQMADETLVFAREDSLHEASQSVDLAHLLAVLGAEQRRLGRDVRCQAAAPLPYRCRPLALTRALNNLVDNAVRYGSRARLSVRKVAGDMRITVDDDGPGIPEACLARVFEPFSRLGGSLAADVGGVGLGLAIARSCIEAHGGRLELINRGEGGLQAAILLPS